MWVNWFINNNAKMSSESELTTTLRESRQQLPNEQMRMALIQWEFSSSPVVKTLHFQCMECGFSPGQGTKIPHATWQSQKTDKKRQRCSIQREITALLCCIPARPTWSSGVSWTYWRVLQVRRRWWLQRPGNQVMWREGREAGVGSFLPRVCRTGA